MQMCSDTRASRVSFTHRSSDIAPPLTSRKRGKTGVSRVGSRVIGSFVLASGAMPRSFVIVGRSAVASDEFLLDDFPGTSGRLDVLVRCIRAALLTSHGFRRDVVVYLVLLGGPRAPRSLRVDGATAKFVRPDERALATLVKKSLSSHADDEREGFVEVRPGIAVARGGLDAVLRDAGARAIDVRQVELAKNAIFVIGDHLGFDEATRAALGSRATAIAVGPVSLHSDDVVTLVGNEIDRGEASPG
jgi:tRNA (pseudouridine54-N1)-methyltransferase